MVVEFDCWKFWPFVPQKRVKFTVTVPDWTSLKWYPLQHPGVTEVWFCPGLTGAMNSAQAHTGPEETF